jgi:tetratricopeptide (TPR) repeat protein
MAAAYELKAKCLVALNNHHEAIINFRKSIAFQREFPNVKTLAPLAFGWFVIENKLKTFYDEVLQILKEFGGNLSAFPKGRYEICSIQAFIYREKNCLPEAREFARQAIQASSERHSGFRNHPTLGLVKDTGTKIHKRLEEIIESK